MRWYNANVMSRRRTIALIVPWLGPWLLWWPAPALPQSVNVFEGFTAHIERQIRQDKQDFVDAQTCTEWFYRQQRSLGQPKAEGIDTSGREGLAWPVIQTSECPGRYPGGLNAARRDFSDTQSALSLSLTFYEFALVGDRNDDGRYNAAELRDVLESFELTYDRNRPDSFQLIVLTGTFDSIRQAGGLERLMASMGVLYDKGYRLTERDRALLDQVTR